MRSASGAACFRLALASLFLFCLSAGAKAQEACDEHLVSFDVQGQEAAFRVELADEPDERMQGLMFRVRLEREAGMLFLQDRIAPASFWMRNTYVPLDILFLDEAGRIVRIAAHTTPLSEKDIPSGEPVRGALEINAGLAEELGLAPGMVAQHPAFQRPWPDWRCEGD